MDNNYKVAVIPGDGTGPEVIREGVRALDAVSKRCGLNFELNHYNLGGETYIKDGVLLPDNVIEELRSKDAIILGAIGHPDVQTGIFDEVLFRFQRFKTELQCRRVYTGKGIHRQVDSLQRFPPVPVHMLPGDFDDLAANGYFVDTSLLSVPLF